VFEAGDFYRSPSLDANAPHCSEIDCGDLMVVYRLITSYSRYRRINHRQHPIIRQEIVMSKTVGIIGLGIMGSAISRNLVERGWRVIGFDIDAARTAELAQAGVTIASDVAEVAREASIVMTSLPTPAAVIDVARAIAGSGQKPRIVVELSTLTIADKLRFEAILSEAGHIALDCPLSGTGAQARMRDLVVYASGDSEAIASCADLFADFAKQSADLGAFGNGSKMKFVANHLVAIHNVATGEAMVLAERAGLDPKMVVDLVGPGAGGSRMFQMRAPMMVERVYEPATMKVSTWKKDMAIIAEFADEIGCATPMFTLTQPVYTEAMAMGLGDQDTAAVFEVLKKTIVTDRKSARK
jgi:L-threonate 2-dehydrogenase